MVRAVLAVAEPSAFSALHEKLMGAIEGSTSTNVRLLRVSRFCKGSSNEKVFCEIVQVIVGLGTPLAVHEKVAFSGMNARLSAMDSSTSSTTV